MQDGCLPNWLPPRKSHLKTLLNAERYELYYSLYNKIKFKRKMCIFACISTSEAKYIECGGSRWLVSAAAAIRRLHMSSQNNRNFSTRSIRRFTDLGINVVQYPVYKEPF